MVNRSTSNQQGEVSKPSPTTTQPTPNIVKRTPEPIKPTDVTPTSEPVAEQPKKTNE